MMLQKYCYLTRTLKNVAFTTYREWRDAVDVAAEAALGKRRGDVSDSHNFLLWVPAHRTYSLTID